MAVVYWIHTKDHKDLFNEGYIGFTSKSVETRLGSHKRNYHKFIKEGVSGGCLKLYAFIKENGGWDNVLTDVVCISTNNYCLYVENALRPLPNTGLNTRAGGDTPMMFGRKLSEETKEKLAIVRSQWVMSDATRKRLSSERVGVGNPMFGVPAWKQSSVSDECKETWAVADEVFSLWNIGIGVRSLHNKHFKHTNFNSLDSMVRKFRKGWNPLEDEEWLNFKRMKDESKASIK